MKPIIVGQEMLSPSAGVSSRGDRKPGEEDSEEGAGLVSMETNPLDPLSPAGTEEKEEEEEVVGHGFSGRKRFRIRVSVYLSSRVREPAFPRDDHHSIFSSVVISSWSFLDPVVKSCLSEKSISLNLGQMVRRRSHFDRSETRAFRSHLIRPSGV